MMKTKQTTVSVPADVPKSKEKEYIANMLAVTHGVGRMALFAGDQKIEHLNDDFYGEGVSPENANPEHLFQIASQAKISVFAAQLGLIGRYGKKYPNIPYLVKLNSKTNLVKTSAQDPVSTAMVNMEQVARFKKDSGLNILGVGYTMYLGSEFENQMMSQLGSIIFEAHQQGLFTVVWMYPRGANVPNERDPHLVAGATGVACSIGTDFVKVNFPKLGDNNDPETRAQAFQEAIASA